MGPNPVMVHEKPAARLRFCWKYVLMANDEADTLIPMPNPVSKDYTLCVLWHVVTVNTIEYRIGEYVAGECLTEGGQDDSSETE